MSRTVKRNKASKYLSRKFESKYKKLANFYKAPLITELVSRVDNYRVEHPDEKVTDTILDRIFDEGVVTFNKLIEHATRKSETLSANKKRRAREEQIQKYEENLARGKEVIGRAEDVLERGRQILKKREDASEQSARRRAIGTRKKKEPVESEQMPVTTSRQPDQRSVMTLPDIEMQPPAEIVQIKKGKKLPPQPQTAPFSSKKFAYLKPKAKEKISKSSLAEIKLVNQEEKIQESGLSGYADKVFTKVFGTPFDTTIGDLMDRLNTDSERFPKAVEASYEILTKDLEKLDDGATKSEIDSLIETVLKIGDDMGKIIRGSESSPKEEEEDEEKEEFDMPDGEKEPSPASSIGDALKTKAKDFISEKISSEISKRTGVPRSVFDPPRVPPVVDPPRPSIPLPHPDRAKKKPKMFDEVELDFGDAGVKPGSKLTNNPEGYDENDSVSKAVRYDDKFPEIPYDDSRSARITLGMIKNPIRDPFKLSLLSRKPMIPFNGQVLEDGRDAQEAITIFQTENFGRLPDYDKIRPETLSMYGNPSYNKIPFLGY